jgi:predicted  nucleic acid-binding Zn-ribbon protein
MHPELTKLLDLQARDLELLDVDSRLQELDAELAALDAELNRLRDGVTSAQRAIDGESQVRDELEAKIEAHRKHQDRRKEKLEFMKTSKEVAGLLAEIDLARGVLSDEENEWIRSSEQVSELEMSKAEAEQRVIALEKTQASDRAGIVDRRKSLEDERARAKARREASAKNVAKPLLQQYDKLRASASRREVVVPLNGPACGSCFTTVPVSRRTQIKIGAVIEGCESCGVILYSAE